MDTNHLKRIVRSAVAEALAEWAERLEIKIQSAVHECLADVARRSLEEIGAGMAGSGDGEDGE